MRNALHTLQKKDESESAPQQVPSTQPSINKMKQSPSLSRSKKWPPSPPSSPSTATIDLNVSAALKSKTNMEDKENAMEEEVEPEGVTMEDDSVRDRINKARARLRRLDSTTQQSPRTPRTPQR